MLCSLLSFCSGRNASSHFQSCEEDEEKGSCSTQAGTSKTVPCQKLAPETIILDDDATATLLPKSNPPRRRMRRKKSRRRMRGGKRLRRGVVKSSVLKRWGALCQESSARPAPGHLPWNFAATRFCYSSPFFLRDLDWAGLLHHLPLHWNILCELSAYRPQQAPLLLTQS